MPANLVAVVSGGTRAADVDGAEDLGAARPGVMLKLGCDQPHAVGQWCHHFSGCMSYEEERNAPRGFVDESVSGRGHVDGCMLDAQSCRNSDKRSRRGRMEVTPGKRRMIEGDEWLCG